MTKPQPTGIKKNVVEPKVVSDLTKPREPLGFWEDFRLQAILIGILSFLLYFNSIFNEYALDDRALIVQNEYVQMGMAGIGGILGNDAYQSYLSQANSGNELPGGRYRPLSIITFAIEQQFLGPIPTDTSTAPGAIKPTGLSDAGEAKVVNDMHVRHVVNVLLYVLSLILLLAFLRRVVLKDAPVVAFVAVLLFAVHPIHTEVVANVKSRDEIMSLIFICLTFIFSFKYAEDKKTKTLMWTSVFYFLALLSKEFAATLIVLLPLSFYLIKKESIAQSFNRYIPLIIPLGVFLVLRFAAEAHNVPTIKQDIMNAPYLFATPVQKLASAIGNLAYYLKLLFWPHPLSSDYSYSQLPYLNIDSPLLWGSLIVHLGLIGTCVALFRKRHALTFAFAIYLLPLLLISNLFFNLGAPLGERLVFFSSVGFTIAVAWILTKAIERVGSQQQRNLVLALVLLPIVVLCGFKTVTRNPDWKNDRTLFLKDVQTVPNSALANGNAGTACIDMGDKEKDEKLKKEWYNKSIQYLDKALKIYPEYMIAHLNRGVCYYKSGDPDRAMVDWDSVRVNYPNQPTLAYVYSVASNYYYGQGLKYGKAGDHENAIKAFIKGADATPRDPDMWFNIGFANLSLSKYAEAAKAFEHSLQLKPGNARAQSYLDQARSHLGGVIDSASLKK